MSQKKQTTITKDAANKQLHIEREFDAPLEQVWDAWTQPDLLDQWWAPKPWKAKTKSMDFREGGTWLYCMEGPDGSQQWCRADFRKIVRHQFFIADDAFCDENGTIDSSLPGMHWKNVFMQSDSGTLVKVEITFASEADMEKIIEMGFEEGFTAAHENLDALLTEKVAP
ncbi:MAG: SRPBCC domain-containing protein [Flavisolibacter sp.]|nr:SRPBCC domain-containing protein [Flavisolibacter sp.]